MKCCCAMLQWQKCLHHSSIFSLTDLSHTFWCLHSGSRAGLVVHPTRELGSRHCTPQSPSRCSWLHLLVRGQEELELWLVWVFEACTSKLARALSGVIALSFRETIECQLKEKTDVALLQKYLSSKGVKLFIKTWTLGSSWFHGASSL